ncbi:MAG: hypothetical protein IK102_10240 [Treponema sp.]|nr:hypothetical protein [Treponema sp.]
MKESKNESNAAKVFVDSEKLDVPINEYYQLILNEYNNERDRKQSIETRSGIILTLIAAFFVFVLEKISLSEIFLLFEEPLNFILLIKILSGLFFFIAFFAAMFFSFLSIKTNKYAFYDVNKITTAKLMSKRIPTFGQIILDFVEATSKNRIENNKKARYFNLGVISLVVCIVCLCIYINII